MQTRLAPGDREQCVEAYARLHAAHPECTVVVHILPAVNCPDYGAGVTVTRVIYEQGVLRVCAAWMKELARKYGLAQQGVQCAHALDQFARARGGAEQAANNMGSWLSHELHDLGSKQYAPTVDTIVI